MPAAARLALGLCLCLPQPALAGPTRCATDAGGTPYCPGQPVGKVDALGLTRDHLGRLWSLDSNGLILAPEPAPRAAPPPIPRTLIPGGARDGLGIVHPGAGPPCQADGLGIVHCR